MTCWLLPEPRYYYGYDVTASSAVAASGTSALNQWEKLAWSFASNIGAIYFGTLAAVMATVSYNTAPNTGSTTRRDDNLTNLYFGNLPRSATLPLNGRGALAMMFNTNLSAATSETYLRWPWKAKVDANLKLYAEYGYTTGTVRDWSGNGNTGTTTGVTIGANPPALSYTLFLATQ